MLSKWKHLLDAQPARQLVQVARVHLQRTRRLGPVALVARQGLRDGVPLAGIHGVAQRAFGGGGGGRRGGHSGGTGIQGGSPTAPARVSQIRFNYHELYGPGWLAGAHAVFRYKNSVFVGDEVFPAQFNRGGRDVSPV